jgi:DNA polymerase I-like protein with 3'-5' exonuclease and polymerase domains
VQGSAADIFKQAVINYDSTRPSEHHLVLLMHDELVATVPADDVDRGMMKLKVAMEAIPLDVALLTDGEWSDKNWAEMKGVE